MQNDTYERNEPRLIIFLCVIFIFVMVSSSTSIVASAFPPLLPQLNKNIAPNGQLKAIVLKAAALLYSGKYNQAIANYDEALAINPNDVDSLTGIGLAIGAPVTSTNESIKYFDKALAINPKAIGALAGKGLALARLGKYNESITYFDKALAINPKYQAAAVEKEITLAAIARNANSTNTNTVSTVTKKP